MISNILPLDRFADICRKVYFAVDDYSQIDFILANGYLSWIFGEHVISSGTTKDYNKYCLMCRKNLHGALLRLPLVLPPSMETIAALALGVSSALFIPTINCSPSLIFCQTLTSVENSKATLAWTFISTAADFGQRLGYHRVRPSSTEAIHNDGPLRAAQERLFWTVHMLEKGLALRLGRASNIRDTEITIPRGELDGSWSTRLAMIHGHVHDWLYSPRGLSQPADERSSLAMTLAGEVRGLINETRAEILVSTSFCLIFALA